MVKNMSTDKFYVIENNVVVNIIVAEENYAAQKNLLRCPIQTPYGTADINWTYIDNTFLPPPRDILREWDAVRQKRNALLNESDLYVMPDRWNSFSNDQQQELSYYRQKLRDIPQDFIDPKEVVFPNRPGFM